MFADLVGPTAPSARMDPEGLREVISACQKCVAETVQRFGRFAAKFVGDDFGYPQAHKDDAEGRERRTSRLPNWPSGSRRPRSGMDNKPDKFEDAKIA
jgi:class 3 adenylate cyclase